MFGDFLCCEFVFSLTDLFMKQYLIQGILFKPWQNHCLVHMQSSNFYYFKGNSLLANGIWHPLHPRHVFFFLAYFNVGQPLFCTHAFCRRTCRIYLQNKTQDDFKVGSCLFTTEDISIIHTCQGQDKGTTIGTQKMCFSRNWLSCVRIQNISCSPQFAVTECYFV